MAFSCPEVIVSNHLSSALGALSCRPNISDDAYNFIRSQIDDILYLLNSPECNHE